MKKVGLYFGSFNPFHIGHLAVAEFFCQSGEIDELRLVVSPKNPLKSDTLESSAADRIESVRRAVDRHKLKAIVSDVEFHLPPPLYTIETMRYLKRSEPDCDFILIIGADNLSIIEKWHDYQSLLREFKVWVYPRRGYDAAQLCEKYGATLKDGAMIDISGTEIRHGEEIGLDMSRFKA